MWVKDVSSIELFGEDFKFVEKKLQSSSVNTDVKLLHSAKIFFQGIREVLLSVIKLKETSLHVSQAMFSTYSDSLSRSKIL